MSIMVDGFTYNQRSDGVYETEDNAIYDSIDDWMLAKEHDGFTAILCHVNGKYLAKYICDDIKYIDKYLSLWSKEKVIHPDAMCCSAGGGNDSMIPTLFE